MRDNIQWTNFALFISSTLSNTCSLLHVRVQIVSFCDWSFLQISGKDCLLKLEIWLVISTTVAVFFQRKLTIDYFIMYSHSDETGILDVLEINFFSLSNHVGQSYEDFFKIFVDFTFFVVVDLCKFLEKRKKVKVF